MRSLTKNYFFNLLYQILGLILPLITAPYISRVLAADTIGQYSFAQSIVSYFILFAAIGTGLYGQRQIARLTAQGGDIRKAFWEITLLRTIGISLALFLYWLSIIRNTDSYILYIAVGIEILAAFFDVSWFYQGMEQFRQLSLFNAICRVVGTICVFAFVKTKSDLVLYVMCNGFAILASNLMQCIGIYKYVFICAPIHGFNPFMHIIPSLRLFVAQLAIQLYTVLDKTMIGLITKSNFENGYYEQSQKIIRMLIALVTSLGSVMSSRIAILWQDDGKQNESQIRSLILFSFRVVFAIGLPIMSGIILIADCIVPLYYGVGYEPVSDMLKFLSVVVPTIGISNIIGIQLLVPSKREKLLTLSVICGSVINITINALLIPKLGAMGAIYASVLSELVVAIVQLYMIRKEIPLRRVAQIFCRYFSYCIFMRFIGIICLNLLDQSILALLITVLLCVFTYGLCLVVMHDPILTLVFSKDNKR